MSVVDQYNDPAFGTLFRQVSRMPGLEAFVKAASVEADEASSLPDSAFAWPDERRYPIHTAEHAALSYAYSKTAQQLPPFVESAIKTAIEVYAIPSSVFEEVKLAAEEDKDDDYLLPELKLFQVKSASQVKRAQVHLVNSLTKLDLTNRATACANLVKKADEHKVELHPEILKLAGLVVSSTKIAQEWLEARSYVAQEVTFKEAYQRLADGLKNGPLESKDRPGLLKLASAIAELDEKAGIDKHYDRKLPDALQTVFNTEKLASSAVDICGTMIPMKKLANLPASFWSDLGGTELSDEVAPGGVVDSAKLATVLETLPLDLKLVLKSQLRM